MVRGCEAASAEFEREAASAERERKLAEFRATKLEEQRALENQADQQNTSRLVQEAEQLAELAEPGRNRAETSRAGQIGQERAPNLNRDTPPALVSLS